MPHSPSPGIIISRRKNRRRRGNVSIFFIISSLRGNPPFCFRPLYWNTTKNVFIIIFLSVIYQSIFNMQKSIFTHYPCALQKC